MDIEHLRKLRIVEVSCHKVLPGPDPDLTLDQVIMAPPKLYRIEEIPRDELHLQDDEMLVPCAHFHKQVYATFGIPFYVRVKHHESLQSLKDRLQKKLDIPDKEWEKIRQAGRGSGWSTSIRHRSAHASTISRKRSRSTTERQTGFDRQARTPLSTGIAKRADIRTRQPRANVAKRDAWFTLSPSEQGSGQRENVNTTLPLLLALLRALPGAPAIVGFSCGSQRTGSASGSACLHSALSLTCHLAFDREDVLFFCFCPGLEVGIYYA
ncbi:Ubiquitin carboxyl-terminal hydrolase 7 [Eumeta japonica]|uniref:ubiquitinyl hydrolase 1 n=1 Tax=Eumeta variegata TaxID=151549 RepID=A0A4C1ZXE3_EUMVA|nr:Ubiquitin carboxyl-terminal hydrolase 7 [Eumeta japonica]